MIDNTVFIQAAEALVQINTQEPKLTVEKHQLNSLDNSFVIIVKFGAGLGNQMLQYASYLALKQRCPRAKVKADIRAYNFSKVHNGFELERIFPIRLDVLYGKRTNKVSTVGRYWHYTLHNLMSISFKMGFNKFNYIRDTGVLNENLFHLNRSKKYYLAGQWGNEKYFKNVEELLREHFTFKLPLDSVNETWAKEIAATNSVSVHIRRGDYIGHSSPFVELSKNSYYPEAFEYLNQMLINPVFYIFSDDAEWCQQNLAWLKKYEHRFVTGNREQNSYKDMQLMSLCKNNIIANSTFSWWGAWLNKNNGKIVICPKKLFYEEEKNNRIVLEFYPESWVKM